MARSAKKIGADVVRCFRRVLRGEKDLVLAHAEGDWEKAWKMAVALRKEIRLSEVLVRDFLRAVRLPGIDLGNPGSREESDGD